MNPHHYCYIHCCFALLPTFEIHPVKTLVLKATSRKLDYTQTKEVIIFQAAKIYLAFPNEPPLSQ